MRRVRGWLLRLGGLFGRARRERELAAEMESHLQMHIDDNLRSGISADEARRQALIKLGGVEQTKEIYRERRGLPLLETLFQDLRVAIRMLRSMHTVLLGVFAGVGLALALLGVYGVVSYSVARRTQEIGVRMALGAGQEAVLRIVMRQGLTLVASGAAIGAAGALGAVRVIASELYGVKSSDPWTFSGGAALILIVGCLACWIPARRAMRVDPMVALRYE